MINSNPETVSTDYDTSDLLFFEPLTLEEECAECDGAAERGRDRGKEQVLGLRQASLFTNMSAAEDVASLVADLGIGPVKFLGLETADFGGVLGRADSNAAALLKGDGSIVLVPVGVAQAPAGLRVQELPPDRFVAGGYGHRVEEGSAELKALRGGGNVLGLIVQFGGQTPLNLAHGLVQAGAPIIGTSVDSIDLAEDRDRFDAALERAQDRAAAVESCARSFDEAVAVAAKLGYPS